MGYQAQQMFQGQEQVHKVLVILDRQQQQLGKSFIYSEEKVLKDSLLFSKLMTELCPHALHSVRKKLIPNCEVRVLVESRPRTSKTKIVRKLLKLGCDFLSLPIYSK